MRYLTVEGAATGAGSVTIAGGTGDFTSTFLQRVAFHRRGPGTLELAHSQTYTGAISGFSTTGTTSLDLGDISFVSGNKANYSGDYELRHAHRYRRQPTRPR